MPRSITLRSAFVRGGAATLLGIALGLAPLAGAVRAADIPRLQGTITDQTGALGDQADAVKAALDDVLEQYKVQVFVLFVRTTEDLTVTEFVDQTAEANSLGADDALILVALDERTDAIWVSNALPITDAEINEVISGSLEPGLRDGDFGGAVIAAAKALGVAALPGVPATSPPFETGPAVPGGGGTDRGGIDLGTLLALLFIGVGIVVIAVWLSARLAAWRETGERDRRLARLARDANGQLIAADDRVRNAEQETGFVEAEFGETEAAPFREAVGEAKRELRTAFALRQRLDDNDPEAPPEREAMLAQMVEAVGRANTALDKQAARIEQLRSLERDAERILAALPAQIEPVEARLATSEAKLDSFAAYAPSAWQAVRGNAAEARKGLSGARAAIARGTEAVKADRAKAAREIAVAQRGIAGAGALLDAIDKLASALQAAVEGLAPDLEAAARDVAEARTALGGAGGERAKDLAAAHSALAAAREAASARPLDPIDAGRRASAARAQAAELLAAVREDAQQAAELAAALDASISAAHAEVDRAEAFIGTRRRGILRRARTRLSEAKRLLAAAVAQRDADPKQAMELARRSDRLAEEAYTLASTDFDTWDTTGRPRGGQGTDMGAVILGSILGSILSGGGRGAGWGGSQWGSPGPGPGSGGDGPFGGGGPFGGSWGGGGGGWGGGHSSGGGFGGFGGGHSQGGRW